MKIKQRYTSVLWSYHTTPYSSINETPFDLTFGTEAVISIEIGEPSPKTALFRLAENEDELRVNLDLLQEMPRAKTRPRQFKPHDLVMKLTPIWEGLFKIIEEVDKGAYRLEQLDD
ncbi:hypothetical protein CR513_34809, partial [Mucuna pruriens]